MLWLCVVLLGYVVLVRCMLWLCVVLLGYVVKVRIFATTWDYLRAGIYMCFPLHSDVGRRGGNMNLPVQLHVKLLQLLIMFASEKDVMDDSVRREWCVCVWGGGGCGVCVGGACVGCVCVCGVCVFVQMSLHNLLYSTCTRVSLQSVMYCTV